jgi:hypothetical protein
VSYNKICRSCNNPFISEARNQVLCGSKECRKINTTKNRIPHSRRTITTKDVPMRERYCLKCQNKFMSTGFGNRLCVSCRSENLRIPDTNTSHINLPY